MRVWCASRDERLHATVKRGGGGVCEREYVCERERESVCVCVCVSECKLCGLVSKNLAFI